MSLCIINLAHLIEASISMFQLISISINQKKTDIFHTVSKTVHACYLHQLYDKTMQNNLYFKNENDWTYIVPELSL